MKIKVCFLVLLVAFVLGAAWLFDNRSYHTEQSNETSVDKVTTAVSQAPDTTTQSKENKIELPSFDEEVVLCSAGALAVYRGELSILEGKAYGGCYKPLVFEYKLYDENGVLYYSESADLANAVQVTLDAGKTYVEIHNLKTATTYYYSVVVGKETYSGSFKTAASTRFIQVEDLYNARDIGGYTTLDGKTIKQGMIIRGTEIDGLKEEEYYLTSEAIAYMMDTFGFVYEMDLRAKSLLPEAYESRFGKDVRHQIYTAPAYGSIFDERYKESVKRIFSDLANSDNYPMYLHCTYGADRTGTIVFLLYGLLNMSEEEMIREYQRSGFFSSKFATSEQYGEIISGVESYEGKTLQEKIISFMINDIGMTQEQIDSIRNILLQ